VCDATSKAVALLYASSARKEEMNKLYPLTALIGLWILVVLRILRVPGTKEAPPVEEPEEDYGTIVAPTV
jgi:hypothetical protein